MAIGYVSLMTPVLEPINKPIDHAGTETLVRRHSVAFRQNDLDIWLLAHITRSKKETPTSWSLNMRGFHDEQYNQCGACSQSTATGHDSAISRRYSEHSQLPQQPVSTYWPTPIRKTVMGKEKYGIFWSEIPARTQLAIFKSSQARDILTLKCVQAATTAEALSYTPRTA